LAVAPARTATNHVLAPGASHGFVIDHAFLQPSHAIGAWLVGMALAIPYPVEGVGPKISVSRAGPTPQFNETPSALILPPFFLE
jgi:hypothetical protein